MATTISPNMGLVVPTVGVEIGPDWATDLNASLDIIDGHNHSAGQGVQVTPDGLNINSDLSFIGNNAISLRSTRFSPESSPISGVSDLNALSVSGVDLYYRDGSGNSIRMTQGGSIVGTSGSITGLVSPASATYIPGTQTFVWQSAAVTPANMDFASAIFRNLSASSKGLTLSPPNAMASDYTLTLPALPASTSIITVTSSGTMAAGGNVRQVNAQTGTTYTPVLADGIGYGTSPIVTMNNSSAQTFTIPTNASVAFPTGTQIDVVQLGTGSVTIAAAGGVTLNSNGSTILGQYYQVSLIKIGTNSWFMTGDFNPNIVATGGTITTDGSFKIHTFTTNGTFQITAGFGYVDTLIIGGGGGGGGNGSGGGGAGGYLYTTGTGMVVGSYPAVIGAGGAGAGGSGNGTVGSATTFNTFTGNGGGFGGGGGNGGNGGSGGGGGPSGGTGGTASQGFAGGTASSAAGGGGGGAGAVGVNAPGATTAGNGGAGLANSITGASVTYAGGGGGGSNNVAGTGGAGGGGAGGGSGGVGTNGTANTGGGGGAGGASGASAGNGGSGIVIVRYRFV